MSQPTMALPGEGKPSRRRPSREEIERLVRGIALDPVAAACAVALVAFPVVATIAASGQPEQPFEGASVAVPAGPPARTLRDLPAAEGAAAGPRALRAAIRRVFDADVAAALERVVRTAVLPRARDQDRSGYPYRYRGVDKLLDTTLRPPLDRRRARAANQLGVTLTWAAAGTGEPLSAERGGPPSAARVAYALFDRARGRGGCLPQLNLAFLLASELSPREPDVVKEVKRARRACPRDPTPLWLLGQFRSLLGDARGAARTFGMLRRRFPRSAAGFAGAADDYLRRAYELEEEQPFGARLRFRRALSRYRQALARERDPGLLAGAARAEAGLRRYRAAAALQERALRRRRRAAELQARRVEYLERAHDFKRSAAAADDFSSSHRFPSGRALSPAPGPPDVFDHEDSNGALSLGAGRLLAVNLLVAPGGVPDLVSPGALDLSFMPVFRDVEGLTGVHRWCPEWSRRRDLVLADRPGLALRGFPRRFRDVRPRLSGGVCEEDDSFGQTLLPAVAEAELRGSEAAVERVPADPDDDRDPLVRLENARQNLWRFAGRFDRARRATAAWATADPEDPVALDRAGEVEFLAGNHDQAARLFGRAVRLSRAKAGTWSAREAEALVKQGTALAHAGDSREALATLARADEVASRAGGLAAQGGEEEDASEPDSTLDPNFLSYHALLGQGNTLLQSHRYRAAEDRYADARSLLAAAEFAPDRSEARGRPEVLANNHALVLAYLGRGRAAVSAAQKAVSADPENPIFLATEGFALRRLGRLRAAEKAYRRALRSDPSQFPAWNDLGVVLAARGRDGEAAAAFRRAVGIGPEYSLGWFNLGVVLERESPKHALASQGALGRALRLDPDLRSRERELIPDDNLVFTKLDLSKPLPPDWSFAESQRRAPAAAAGFALALLLGLRLFGTLLGSTGQRAGKWLDLATSVFRRVPQARVFTSAAIAALATVVAFLLPLLLSGDSDLTELFLVALGVGALIGLVMRARAVAARMEGVKLGTRGWTPGIAVGLVGGAAGIAWAPLPVAETRKGASAVHWAGAATTAVVGVAVLVLGSWLEVPASRAVGSAAVVMTASMLTPLRPLDGGYISKGSAGLLANIALVGVSVLLLLGIS